MSTSNAFYVRVSNSAQARELQAEYPSAVTESGSQFYCVRFPDEEYYPPRVALQQLSSKFSSDVLWLSMQTSADAFQFHHWQSGRHLRGIMYGVREERTWEQVGGTPEPWEEAVFFGDDYLADRIGEVDPDEAEEMQRIWRDKELAVGSSLPAIEARECAEAVVDYYKLPHDSRA